MSAPGREQGRAYPSVPVGTHYDVAADIEPDQSRSRSHDLHIPATERSIHPANRGRSQSDYRSRMAGTPELHVHFESSINFPCRHSRFDPFLS